MKAADPRAFIFDVGDTLVGFTVHDWAQVDLESARALVQAARGLLNPLPSVESFARTFRRIVDEAQRQAVPRLEEVPARRCLERTLAELGYRNLPRDVVDHLERAWCGPRLAARHVFDDVHQVLSKLARWGFRLGIISNIWLSGPIVREHLRELGLAPYFHSVVLSSEVGKIKPHPELFRRSLAELGVRPEQAWYIGDNPHADVAGAAAVGMHAVLIRRPPYPGRVEPPDAPYDGPPPQMVIEGLEPLLEVAHPLADPPSGGPDAPSGSPGAGGR